MKRKVAILVCLIVTVLSLPEILHKNKGYSTFNGTFSEGNLSNSYLLPFSGNNYSYFSLFSYFIMDNAYMHSDVYNTLIDAYSMCEKTCPNTNFKVMECANKYGGKMRLHRTHQIGMSVDFLVVKKSGSSQSAFLDHLGLAHYLLKFTNDGKSTLDNNIKIDFETCAKHILALTAAADKNGLKISKIIFKLELIDDLLATPSGKKIRELEIYFAQYMPSFINDLHDDHYHIDFKKK